MSDLMTIHINLPDERIISLEVTKWKRISDVKKMMEEKENIPIENQHLVFKGKELWDYNTLSRYEIENGSTILLFTEKNVEYWKNRVEGCGEELE